MTFKFAAARAQVCEHCKFVVARTDRGLEAQGRMADLIEIPTPLQLGVEGNWNGEPFEVVGRLQMDRAGAPGAPWQEILLYFPTQDSFTWVAYAMGRWYATNEQPLPEGGVPPVEQLRPGGAVSLGSQGSWVVSEVAQRRVVSGEGELSNAPAPGVVTRYADISAAGGRYGTIDYGDGSAPPELYLGQQIDPAIMKLESGQPIDMPEARVTSVECPNCGGDLPIISERAERIVCQYCGTASDLAQGHLSALGPAPKPPIMPMIPIGAEGNLRGNRVVCCGFVIRSCWVDGEVFSWREYLLFAGERVGYQWLIEDSGQWQHVTPLEAGEILDSGHTAIFRGQQYALGNPPVTANVDYVIGEFYWKVEIGEQVEAAELGGPGGKISREKTRTEVNYSFCTPISPHEVFGAFGLAAPAGAGMAMAPMGDGGGGGASSCQSILVVVIVIFVILMMVMGGACSTCGTVGGSGYRGGGTWGGK